MVAKEIGGYYKMLFWNENQERNSKCWYSPDQALLKSITFHQLINSVVQWDILMSRSSALRLKGDHVE